MVPPGARAPRWVVPGSVESIHPLGVELGDPDAPLPPIGRGSPPSAAFRGVNLVDAVGLGAPLPDLDQLLRPVTGDPSRPVLVLVSEGATGTAGGTEVGETNARTVPVVPAAGLAEPPESAPHGWALDLPGPSVDPSVLDDAAARGARWIRVPGGLRSASALEELASAAGARAIGVVVHDPFDGGRFDGSFLRESGPDPAMPPARGDAQRRMATLAPVLPYGFLAIAQRRSLLQAVVRYLVETEGVAGVVIPPSPPERFVAAAGAFTGPPLTGDDRARIRALAGNGRAGIGPLGGTPTASEMRKP